MIRQLIRFSLLAALVSTGFAQLPAAEKATKLVGDLAPLQPFVGDWEIDATWAHGGTLRARNEFRVGLAGRFMTITTVVQDNGGPVYDRYQTIYQATPDGIIGHGFVFDGSAKSVPVQFDPEKLQLLTEVEENGAVIRNNMERIDDNSYAWKVHMKAPGSDQWAPLMDGVWKRVTETKPVRPVDHASFVGRGDKVRQFSTSGTIDAPVRAVYAAWASGEAWGKVYPTPSKAHIELAIGGRYEWLFDGKIGSNGCQVLSYIPNRMISFSWNAPPTQPESRGKHTWVVVEFDEQGGKTEVTVTHLGFGEGSQWDETMAYFEAAWPRVLASMGERLGR